MDDKHPDETEYVGAPTEFADAQEMPDWAQTLAKVVYALPAALTALSVIQITVLVVLVACIALVALVLLAL